MTLTIISKSNNPIEQQQKEDAQKVITHQEFLTLPDGKYRYINGFAEREQAEKETEYFKDKCEVLPGKDSRGVIIYGVYKKDEPVVKSLYENLKEDKLTEEDKKKKLPVIGENVSRFKDAADRKQSKHQRMSKLGKPFQAGKGEEKFSSGKVVTIKGKPSQNHIYGGEWGVITGFDGDRYHIAINGSNVSTVFDEKDLISSQYKGQEYLHKLGNQELIKRKKA